MSPRPKPPRRIAYLVTRLDFGGAQLHVLHCCGAHDPTRFAVHLLAGAGGRLDDSARHLPHVAVTLAPWFPYDIAPHRDALAVLRTARWLRAHRIELVHTHCSKAGVIGRAAARLAGVPAVVHTVHGWSFNPTQTPAKRGLFVRLERIAARATDAFVAVSDENRRTGLEQGIGTSAKYHVLPSGIAIADYAPDAARREATRRTLGYAPHHRVVGSIAALKAQKAPLDFVRAAEIVARQQPDARFFIAGGGELHADTQRAIEAAGLGDKVQLLGWRDDAPDLLRAMDIFLLTSVFEGLPQSVLQALASETPVVATAVNGTPEVVRDGETGRLVPPHDPPAQAQATAELLDDPAQAARFAQAGRAALTERFDRDVMVQRLEALYASLR